MTCRKGVGNDGHSSSSCPGSAGSLNIGIKVHECRNSNIPAGSITQSGLSGGGTWLNLDGQRRCTTFAGVAVNKPSWNPAAPSWGFT